MINLKNKKAFSLVELMMTVTIFSCLLAAVYTAFLGGNRSWSTYENNVALQRDTRGALLAIVPDLREAENVVITQSSSAATLDFSTSTLGNVSYTWNDTGGNANQLLRTVGATTRTLARNISALAFTDLGSGVLVDITSTSADSLGKSSSFNLKQKVTYR